VCAACRGGGASIVQALTGLAPAQSGGVTTAIREGIRILLKQLRANAKSGGQTDELLQKLKVKILHVQVATPLHGHQHVHGWRQRLADHAHRQVEGCGPRSKAAAASSEVVSLMSQYACTTSLCAAAADSATRCGGSSSSE
jgi:hypothetical protein